MKFVKLTTRKGTPCYIRCDMIMHFGLFEPSDKTKKEDASWPSIITEVELSDQFTTSLYVMEHPDEVARLIREAA